MQVIKLSSGQIKFDLEGASVHTIVARSSHGRLLASFFEDLSNQQSSILIWKMSTGESLANIEIPTSHELLSLEFSRNGRELWVLLKDQKSTLPKIVIWKVPPQLEDAADILNFPAHFNSNF